MKWFRNLKISVKLIAGFLIVALIAGIVGVVGLVNLNRISEADKKLYNENTLGIEYAGNVGMFFQRIRFNTVRMLVAENANDQNTCNDNVNEYQTEVEKNMKLYEEGIVSGKDKDLFNAMKPLWVEYTSLLDKAIKSLQLGHKDQAYDLIFGDIAKIGDDLRVAIDAMIEYNSIEGKTTSDNNIQLARMSTIILVIVVIIGVIIAIILGLFISRIISKPINEMVDAADKLALGDVNVNVTADTKDEVGNLADSFKRMIENVRKQAMVVERIADGDLTIDVEIRSEADLLGKKLAEMVKNNNEILSNIASAAEQVAVGAKQVSDSSIELSEGAAEQASSVEELTASIQQISSQIELTAQNANQANELAEDAKENAAQGSNQMDQMLEAMAEINKSSDNISKIIKVIDEIAFQTNILALNAAVEATRAGQHGRGFAVVAEEVRNLAARSANAAKETTDMIEDSIRKSEDGTKIAQETANALNKIIGDIGKVAELGKGIAVASNEQAAGIEQINQGVVQISEVVQNNSATSEESAAASEELSSQAQFLEEMVGNYKLKKDTKIRSHNELEDINPEVLKMLEDMQQKGNSNSLKGTKEEKAAQKDKIRLGDKEFGKY